MTTALPTWLRQHLVDVGKLDTDGISRRVKARTCRHCHTPILTGLDASLAAMPARTQPHPVSPLGEALALAAGAPTYDLIPAAHRYELEYRDDGRIAAARRWPVVAAHRCWVQWPEDPHPPMPPRYARAAAGDRCPF
jgi:hypothetical protein